MRHRNPSTGLIGWIGHRLISNYWFLALCAVVSAPIVFAVSLVLDREGLAQWLIDSELAPVRTADAAKEVAGVVAGIDAAFVTLYFSISLIVLTIAAGNLGVRLVDRWLGRRLVRVSIAGLSFTLIFAVLTLAAIDSEAALEDTPLATMALTVLFVGVNVVMLAVALHDLGRSMFVDKAIDWLADDAIASMNEVTGQLPFTGHFAQTILVSRDGYVEGVDLDYLAKRLADHSGAIRICAAPGQHVLAGEPLARFEHALDADDVIRKAMPIGPFRSNRQGAVFQVRLLVEIAARALSPAVNDFYTALAAADALSEVIMRHAANWVVEGEIAVSKNSPQFELCGQDFRQMFDNPLDAFRQAAADYPSVAIRMIGNYGRVIALGVADPQDQGVAGYLRDKAREMRDHAQLRAQLEADKADIAKAFSQVQALLTSKAAVVSPG